MDHKRYVSIEEVPIKRFAVWPCDHPDIDIIVQAYKQAGAGIAIDGFMLGVIANCEHDEIDPLRQLVAPVITAIQRKSAWYKP